MPGPGPSLPSAGLAGRLTGDFFDTERVMRALSKAQRRALSGFGAFVRTRSKTSIKYRKGKSQPGSPPFAHKGSGFTRKRTNKRTGAITIQQKSPLKELIFFSFDSTKNSVVIGPLRFGSRPGMEALEYGGAARIRFPDGKVKTAKIKERPFMRPAFATELPRWRALLRDSMGK